MRPYDPPDTQPRVPVSRSARLPDPLRLGLYNKAPELGPRLLFFSGGSALNPTSRALINYTHNSIHVVTTFDSGGSSGKLRRVLEVPAVGDLRSRIMALADRTVRGQAEVYELFSHRLPLDDSQNGLRESLYAMAAGNHALVRPIPAPLRDLIRHHLRHFLRGMPDTLDLRGASIGNLILVGGYLNNHHDLNSVVFLFSRLVEARGLVLPSCTANLHLGVVLEDGSRLNTQHLFSGKDAPPIASPIRSVFVASDDRGKNRVRPTADSAVREAIINADMICFPMGSLYSSVIANLLPDGVCDAIAKNHCPKVYVPNTGADPEQLGLDVAQSASVLRDYLRAGCTNPPEDSALLTHVLLHRDTAAYASPCDRDAIRKLQVEVIESDIVTTESAPKIDPQRLLDVLLSLV